MILLQQFSKFNFDRSGALRVFAIPLSRRQSSNNDGQSDPDDGGLIVGVEEDVYHLFPFDRNYRDGNRDSVGNRGGQMCTQHPCTDPAALSDSHGGGG